MLWTLLCKIVLPGSSDGKESAFSSVPELGRCPRGGHGNSLQYSCLENSHGPRSLAGYSPWGHKEPDMTEQWAYKHILPRSKWLLISWQGLIVKRHSTRFWDPLRYYLCSRFFDYNHQVDVLKKNKIKAKLNFSWIVYCKIFIAESHL